MIKEKHHVKLTKNERRVLDYIINKAETNHSLTNEIPPTELMEKLHFNSLKTAYNNINKLIEKKLITKLADDITLDANKFVFQKEAQDKKVLNLKFVLQELEIERDLFPFLEPENRVKYFQMVAENREAAAKIDYQLTRDICKLADAGVYEFELQPIKGSPKYAVPSCTEVLATCNNEEHGTFKTYEDRELQQAIDYLKVNPEKYLNIAFEYSNQDNELIRFLFNKYIFADVTE